MDVNVDEVVRLEVAVLLGVDELDIEAVALTVAE